MSLAQLTNEKLVAEMKRLKTIEDTVLVEVLDHINEFEKRQLHLPLGFPSLYAYLTQELRYSDGEAYRRIEAARMMRSVPESRCEVSAGRLNLTNMTEARSAIKTKEKLTGRAVPISERREFLNAVVGCSKAEAQRNLAEKLPELTPMFLERRREHRDGSMEITLLFQADQRKRLERAKDLLASQGPMLRTVDTIDRLSEFYLSRKDLTRSLLAGEETLRHTVVGQKLPISMRRAVFKRDEGLCQHRNPEGKICGSRYQIEIDHIVPVSAGGSNELSNLRCLCRAHNQWKGNRRI